jgi:Domain of unknown function (DUF4375)
VPDNDGSGSELTEAQIRETPDDDLPMLVFSSGIRPGDEHVDTIWVVELLNMEIGNGDHVQYFANTGGEYIDETRRALARIGATHHLAVYNRAVARFEEERPQLEELWRTEEGFSRSYKVSTLSEFDDLWYEVAIEPIESAYIRAHIESFV